MRDKGQQIWDKIALLNLFKEVNRSAWVSGALHLQKLTFLLELQGQEFGIKSAHYRFFRYNMGPYSADLAQDLKSLRQSGFLAKTSEKMTRRADFVLEYTSEYFAASDEAKMVLEIIKAVSEKYGKFSGARLMRMVYKLKVPVCDFGGEIMQVEDIPFHFDILDPANTPSLTEPNSLPTDIIADLEEEFALPDEELDPASASFKRTIRNAMARLEVPSSVS